MASGANRASVGGDCKGYSSKPAAVLQQHRWWYWLLSLLLSMARPLCPQMPQLYRCCQRKYSHMQRF